MSTSSAPKRRWGSAYQLHDLLEQSPGGLDFAVRDFALLTLAGHISASFAGQLVFKGGFVLRHVHGALRFSKDLDATRENPAKHKLDANQVAEVIRAASIGDTVRFDPEPPARHSASSLDFEIIRVTGALMEPGEVQVEVSYREQVIDPTVQTLIGLPFYEPFTILAMSLPEMASEKLRTLAQRARATDLADLAVILSEPAVGDEHIGELAVEKFKLVKQGAANRIRRIEENLRAIGADYQSTVPGVFPSAPSYRDAMAVVWPRIKPLVP